MIGVEAGEPPSGDWSTLMTLSIASSPSIESWAPGVTWARCLALAAAFHKIPLSDITAFHDELDLAPGKIRVKKGGGAAGHNGLRDMDRRLGAPDYWRVRLGIGHPGAKEKVTGHVLGNFAKVDTWLEPMLDAVAEAAPLLARGETEAFMTRVALLTQES